MTEFACAQKSCVAAGCFVREVHTLEDMMRNVIRLSTAAVITVMALATMGASERNVTNMGIQRWRVDLDHNGTIDLCRVILKNGGKAIACSLSPTNRVDDLY